MIHLTQSAKRRSVWLALGSVLIVAGVATATTLLFTQSFPPVTLAGLAADCLTLTADNGIGGNLAVNFDCTVAGFAPMVAFVVGIPGSYTPTFTLPSGAAQLWVISASTAGPGAYCFGQGGSQLLGTGSAISLSAGNYDYCLQLNSGTTLVSAFTVTWAQ
ncbi:MAG: hypothetical protein L3J97_04695 [Thermoplasmata archaeon]|nr:hypothetical protein [Thermoplasmata archaeon]